MRKDERRKRASVCERCARKIDPAVGACVECSRLAGVVFTRLTDPVELRRPRYGPRKISRQ